MFLTALCREWEVLDVEVHGVVVEISEAELFDSVDAQAEDDDAGDEEVDDEVGGGDSDNAEHDDGVDDIDARQ